jgi:hypothetical protein
LLQCGSSEEDGRNNDGDVRHMDYRLKETNLGCENDASICFKRPKKRNALATSLLLKIR